MIQFPRASAPTFAHNDAQEALEVLEALEGFDKLVADARQLAENPALPDGRRLMCSLFLDAQATSLRERKRPRRATQRPADPEVVISVPVRAGGSR